MKIISRQSLVCSALALMLSVAVSSRDAAAAGAGSPEPGAGCEAALGKICSVIHGAPYLAGAMIQYLDLGGSAEFSSPGAAQLGNSFCTMGDPGISGGVEMTPDAFNSLTRKDIQGFCVTNAVNECDGTDLAEVLAVQKFDGPVMGTYEVQVLLLPIVCEDL